ncbi:unnamed protein product [Protopolystoma xenopodis]|uniref:Uncharacterized protein n=1 Tax=Protopolystoma xenopodis TaxID=117903 RepID=A0A3S5BC77_9PLAT|nr:unnamed protein product [Protopolystoma xenopodis]
MFVVDSMVKPVYDLLKFIILKLMNGVFSMKWLQQEKVPDSLLQMITYIASVVMTAFIY